MDRYQYRITVGDTVSNALDTCPSERWSQLAELSESRGIYAKLERRFITTPDFLELLMYPEGWKVIGNILIGPWQTEAELGIDRTPILIGGEVSASSRIWSVEAAYTL